MKVTASTPLYALLGNPVRQSLSPVLHNGWIAEHDFDGVYVALNIEPENFEQALTGLYHSGLMGANITTPFKERAAQSAYRLSQRASVTHSANCLTYHDLGFAGDSTDGSGFIADLDARAPGWRDIQAPIILIGAGGAARALLYALIEAGQSNVIVVNRDTKRAQEAVAPYSDEVVRTVTWDTLAASLVGAGLVINATSAGFNGQKPLSLDFSQTHARCVVYDTVYAPRETIFLGNARQSKRTGLDGLGMLVGQGALAFENWFGVRPDLVNGLARLEAELVS